MKYSRLYGYRGLQAVAEEQDVIRHVVHTIASSKEPIEQVNANLVRELNDKGIRRSGKKWLTFTVLALVRPVFGGRIAVDGAYAVSEHYKPAVEWDLMKIAITRVKGLK